MSSMMTPILHSILEVIYQIPFEPRTALIFLVSLLLLYWGIFKLAPRLLEKVTGILVNVLEKLFEFILYPFNIIRRKVNNKITFFLIKLLGDICSFIVKFFYIINTTIKNKPPLYNDLVQKFQVLFQMLIILLPLGIIVWSYSNPNSVVLSKWREFEYKTVASLGYNINDATNKVFIVKYEIVYIRNNPGVYNQILVSVRKGEVLNYLNEQQTDTDGAIWYRIQTAGGVNGWVRCDCVEEH